MVDIDAKDVKGLEGGAEEVLLAALPVLGLEVRIRVWLVREIGLVFVLNVVVIAVCCATSTIVVPADAMLTGGIAVEEGVSGSAEEVPCDSAFCTH